MKPLKFAFLFITLFLAGTSIFAQNKKNETVYIKSVKFATPLIEKWISEYSKQNPDIQIKLAEANQEADIDLLVKANEASAENNVIYVGRYALLPVADKNNSALEQLSKTKLNKKIIKELFFENELLDNENKKLAKIKESTTIYSGNKNTSGATIFASHFGYNTSDLRGKRISGDDLFLLNAIEKDPTGITINNLAYIYDINTRQLKTNIVLLPLDLKKDQREVLSSSNLDETIKLLEEESIDLIPVAKIGFAQKNTKPIVDDFIQWILTEGQVHNHNFGFLNLDKETLLAQQKSRGNIYLTARNSK